GGRRAAGALLFTCNGRGSRMFSEPDHDAGLLAKLLGEVPVAGFFCAGELGPVGGQNFLHGFTASIALFPGEMPPSQAPDRVGVGVYVDGFNLYYGARSLAGRGTPGWRWLDLRALATDLVGRRSSWPGAEVSRVVYCTARIDAVSNPSGQADQDVYLKALV